MHVTYRSICLGIRRVLFTVRSYLIFKEESMRRVIFILALLTPFAFTFGQTPSLTNVIFPRYIQGNSKSGNANDGRVPIVCWATITGLKPNTLYRYYNQLVRLTYSPTADTGVGNFYVVPKSGNFRRISGTVNLVNSALYDTFTTDLTGSYAKWFANEPTGLPVFTPGGYLFLRIYLNDGAGGTTVAARLTTSDSARVIKFGRTAGDPLSGTGLRGNSSATPKEFILLYDNTAGLSRPVSGTYVESDGVNIRSLTTLQTSYAYFYRTFVDTLKGAYGAIIPNVLPGGIQRIERRSLLTGMLVSYSTSASGIWPSGANTVNPVGGDSSEIIFTRNDAALGSPAQPEFIASKSSLAFGKTGVGYSTIDSVEIVNTGYPPLHITSIKADSQFAVSPSAVAIDSLGKKTIRVSFVPTSTGTKTGRITFVHDGLSSPDVLTVTGTAVAPIPEFKLLNPVISFGEVAKGASKTDTIRIMNTGYGNLRIDSVLVNNSMFVITDGSIVIEPQTIKGIRVRFDASALGSTMGTVTIYYNASGGKSSATLNAVVLTTVAPGFTRRSEIHRRSMLQETIFNTGEIGRSYTQGNAGNVTAVPLMEWPSNSRVTIDKIEYDGQHNTLGGGLWLSGSAKDVVGPMYAFCGGSGAGTTEIVDQVWSFPMDLIRIENYPLLQNGNLNPRYNPDEAEEVIISKWGTSMGLTVTRTSRAWSYPGYDDFIIYEYEIENTGDRDADHTTIESHETVRDMLVTFAYGYAPSMFGYMMKYKRWYYQQFEVEQRARFDFHRWLNYQIDNDGKPVIDPLRYDEWGRLKKFGGGLLSPQAVGFSLLYHDVNHLITYGESSAITVADSMGGAWDPVTARPKQPWSNFVETSNTRSSKEIANLDVSKRIVPITAGTTPWSADWRGRGGFKARTNFGGRALMLGPYNLVFGEKIRFAVAELAGYGAAKKSDGLLRDIGGQSSSATSQLDNPVPRWDTVITYGSPATNYGSDYLKKYPYPDYVDTAVGVITIRDVADKAIETYTGDLYKNYNTLQYWPDQVRDRGSYKIPIPYPAPVFDISTTKFAENVLSWKNQVESFAAPRMTGDTLQYYEVLRSDNAMGPWTKIDSVARSDTAHFKNGVYSIIDPVGMPGVAFYYAIVSVDNKGFRSGRTNITLVQAHIRSLRTSAGDGQKVYAIPNPFFLNSGFQGTTMKMGDINDKIGFFNLPRNCVIRIFSYSGQLIETIVHDSEYSDNEWFQVTRNNQFIASGIYFFVVETKDGKMQHGKFVVIH
jgi:hypothetical protein